MKQIVFLMLLTLTAIIFMLNSCNCSCPDEQQYHFFTEDELKLLWENIDPLMDYQNYLSINGINRWAAANPHVETGIIQYINQSGDTLEFSFRCVLRPNYSTFCTNNTSMTFEYFLLGGMAGHGSVMIDVLKNAFFTEPRPRLTIGTSFFSTTFIVSSYEFNGKNIENCLIFKFEDRIDNLEIIYSNKYGFLRIKNNEYEIKRLL